MGGYSGLKQNISVIMGIKKMLKSPEGCKTINWCK